MQSDGPGTEAPVQVQCVYGAPHVAHIEAVLLPALARSTRRAIVFAALNYEGPGGPALTEGRRHDVDVRVIVNPETGATGFGAGHNRIFTQTAPVDPFVLLNPDCIPQEGAIDALLARRSAAPNAGIVEGRQWPFEHPKEFDTLTHETPWASGAFCLLDARFYARVGGMDERYFLYNEDVDLSWRAWLGGYTVLYEPNAVVAHFSNGPFARADLVSNEAFYSLRNFLLIAQKFFGEPGLARARAMLDGLPDETLAAAATAAFAAMDVAPGAPLCGDKIHPKVKILGLNRFHEVREP